MASAYPPAPCVAVARALGHVRPEGKVRAELVGVVRVHSKVVPHLVVPPMSPTLDAHSERNWVNHRAPDRDLTSTEEKEEEG